MSTGSSALAAPEIAKGLPVIQRPIDNTAMTAYMSCPREYLYGMHEHRRPTGRSAALVFGGAYHAGLEAYYSGGDLNDMKVAALEKWEDHGAEGDYRTLERCWIVLEKYLKRWPDSDREETIGWPENPLVEVSTHVMGPELSHPYAGKIDRIVVVNGLGYIEDHKTTSRLDKWFFKQFENSNQMMGYVYMAQQLVPGIKIVGARINVAHVLKTKEDFHRAPVTFTPEQIKHWADNYNRWAQRIALDSLAYEWESGKLDEGEVEDLAKAMDLSMDVVRFFKDSSFPGHYGTNGCDRKYGLCVYHRVCGASPKIRQKVLEAEFEVSPWNPLEADEDND